MKLVCLEECANGNKYVQEKENGPRIHNGKGTNNNIMPSDKAKEILTGSKLPADNLDH